MKLKNYKSTLQEPLKQATLCFLVKDNQVLLAMKKRGFGVGKFNGIGGKKEAEERDNGQKVWFFSGFFL